MKPSMIGAVVLLSAVCVPPARGVDAGVPAVKELKLKGLRSDRRARGYIGKPQMIGTAKALEKVAADKDRRAEIKKQVDFSRQQIVLFKWAGSGQDRVEARVRGTQVIFRCSRGKTEDFRGHVRFFAVRKGMTVKVEPPKIGTP